LRFRYASGMGLALPHRETLTGELSGRIRSSQDDRQSAEEIVLTACQEIPMNVTKFVGQFIIAAPACFALILPAARGGGRVAQCIV
jgi:hypothetical protein